MKPDIQCKADDNSGCGHQRHDLDRLQRWERLEYGMFLHFGMSTFDRVELSLGDQPPETYAPSELDVDQWVRVAKEAGMRYAVLTAKHVSGFCLWPSAHTDYHVGNSGNTTDVVAAFVEACERYGLRPGLYYCSWDNHHRLGSETPNFTHQPYTTEEYRAFQRAQIEELLTDYGSIEEVWIDIPNYLGRDGRNKQYEQIVRLQPDAVVMMNAGFGDGTDPKTESTWPTDIVAIERDLPNSASGYQPWHDIDLEHRRELAAGPAVWHGRQPIPPKRHYLPGEVCDTISKAWFYYNKDDLRSDGELLGMRLIARERGANFLLNVPPDPRGLIREDYAGALRRLRRNLESNFTPGRLPAADLA